MLRRWGIIGFFVLISACQNQNFVTPPPDPLGNNLNSIHSEKNPRLSDDGRFLVFSSDRRQQRRIFLYDLSQRKLLPLPGLNQPRVFYDQPDISRNGRYLVYTSEQDGKTDVFLYDRQTFQSRNLTKTYIGQVRNPTISGDGRWIAFEGDRTGQWDIEVIDRGVQPDLVESE
ncbi:MAG: biopolymer transporter [Limnothrix sp. RL_2_0]|nr:biopolymer transporter [Limnothrix sp. RL_2_0]